MTKKNATPLKKTSSAPAGARVQKAGVAAHAIAPPAVIHAATADAGLVIKPDSYDPVKTQATLERILPRLRAFSADQLAALRVDVRGAALAAMRVHALVTQSSSLHARFVKLHEAGELEIGTLGDVRDAASVVLYTFAQAEAAGAFESDAKVPVSLVKEAATVEGRMQELLEYKFKRDPDVAPLLAVLRPGTGHRDLAADLFGYADIYVLKHEEIAVDTTNYRATDLADARRLAGEIMAHLSAAMSPKARDATDLLQRAWTLLLQTYFEVREVGTCLLRYDPKRYEKFPSLFTAGRAGRARTRKEEMAPEPQVAPTPVEP